MTGSTRPTESGRMPQAHGKRSNAAGTQSATLEHLINAPSGSVSCEWLPFRGESPKSAACVRTSTHIKQPANKDASGSAHCENLCCSPPTERVGMHTRYESTQKGRNRCC